MQNEQGGMQMSSLYRPRLTQVNSPNRSTLGPCASVNGYCYYTTGVGRRHGWQRHSYAALLVLYGESLI
jgi:hypothetical protein